MHVDIHVCMRVFQIVLFKVQLLRKGDTYLTLLEKIVTCKVKLGQILPALSNS